MRLHIGGPLKLPLEGPIAISFRDVVAMASFDCRGLTSEGGAGLQVASAFGEAEDE